MLRVFVLWLLAVGTISHDQNPCDTEQERLGLIPSLLRLERTVTLLSTKVEKNTADVSSMKSELRDKDTVLLNLTRTMAQLQTDVAFEARLPHNMDGVPDRVAIKFTGIVYNKHNGFSSSSGIFTAPVSGTYIIWAHIMSHDKHRLHVLIKHNGKIIGQSHTSGGVAVYEVPSITAVIPLNKGDQVWFAKFGSPKLRGDNWSSYGGALIHAV